MPAAVGALMGTIPEDKAGVGSALNDTVQQAGTALGIAILGSLLSSGFADRMPEGTPEEARHSIAGAVAGGDAGLIAAAREAFTASMSTTFTVSAIGVAAAALLATLVMRDDRRKPDTSDRKPATSDRTPDTSDRTPDAADDRTANAADRTAENRPEPVV